MKKELSYIDILQELKSRGEYSITFSEDGLIYSRHGKATCNVWTVKDGELICIDCRTVYPHSI